MATSSRTICQKSEMIPEHVFIEFKWIRFQADRVFLHGSAINVHQPHDAIMSLHYIKT